MYARVAALAVLLMVVGCGGSTATQPPATTGPNTVPTPPSGASIDSTAITAAVAALNTHGSWTFNVTAIKTGAPTAVQLTLTGTQRTSPQAAVSATLAQTGTADKRYTRIVDDIWYDAGTGTYVKTTAADSAVVSQFEPYYLSNLASAAEANGYTYNLVGPDTVNDIAATHYRLSESQLQSIVKTMNLSTAQWAADVWIATDGGYLVRLAWGPQTLDTAQIPVGFNYVVTSVDCNCPVAPPT